MYSQKSNMTNQKTLLSSISNKIFTIFCVFIITFIWINIYIKSLKLSIFSSAIITISFCIIYFPISFFTNKRKNLKNTKLNNIEYLKEQLLFGNNSESIETICKAYNYTNYKIISKNHIYDPTSNTDLFFYFDSLEINDEKIIQAIKERYTDNIKLFCINNVQLKTPQNITLNIETPQQIFDKLSTTSLNLDHNISCKQHKISRAEIFKSIFNSQKSKSYFSFGLLILFSSLFTIYNIYYIIFGTALILLSLYSKLNKKFN